MLFILGGFWFWSLTAIASLAILILFANDKLFTTMACVAIYLTMVEFWGDANLRGVIAHHPVATVVLACGYLAIGVVWAAFKWMVFCNKHRRQVNDKLVDFIVFNTIPVVKWKNLTEDQKINFDAFLMRHDLKRGPLNFSSHGTDFGNWFILWPLSVLCTFFGDFLVDLADFVTRLCSRSMQRISDKIWEDFQ